MEGILQTIDVTEQLAWKYAKHSFEQACDGQDLCEHGYWVRASWLSGAQEDLNNFNDVVEFMNKINRPCEFEVEKSHDDSNERIRLVRKINMWLTKGNYYEVRKYQKYLDANIDCQIYDDNG